MGNMKTPGVYIVEKNAFPNSVVEVATAVPAFIGYTEKALNQGLDLELVPWRITSMAEYHQYFGLGPVDDFVRFSLKDTTPADTTTATTATPTGTPVPTTAPAGTPAPTPAPTPPKLGELPPLQGRDEIDLHVDKSV